MKIFIIVLISIVFMLLIFLAWLIYHVQKQAQKELSFDPDVYTGPAGEPLWKGTLPSRVDDYVKPRYVYENLVESYEYLPKNGRVIGYRISPELVIHSRIYFEINLPGISAYIKRSGGKFLNLKDSALLLDNWLEIALLREKCGDTPLDAKAFWALSESQVLGRVDVRSRKYEDMVGYNSVWCALILKR